MTNQIATVVSLPRNCTCHYELCEAKRSNLIKRCAFTLAEVLITLGIIGVVAAITLPILVQNYQKKVTVERLKQTYSILSQAIKMSEIDNGPVEEWNIPDESNPYEHGKQFSEQYLIPYIKSIKTIKSTSNKFYIRLNNGVSFWVWPRNGLGVVEINVDINSEQGPNKRGRDNFTFILTSKDSINGAFGKNIKKGSFVFYGQGYDRNYLKTRGYPCAKTGNFAGVYCGALIFLDGWQIAKDYPW